MEAPSWLAWLQEDTAKKKKEIRRKTSDARNRGRGRMKTVEKKQKEDRSANQNKYEEKKRGDAKRRD